MVDFNTLSEGAPLGSSVTPSQPVVNRAIEAPLALAGTVVAGVSSEMRDARYYQHLEAARKYKQGEETATGKAISDLTSRLTPIADAVERGDMTPAEAGVRKRAVLGESLAANPLQAKDLQASFNAFGTDAGAVSKTGSEDFQLQKDRYKEATVAGWVTPNMSVEQKTAATDSFFQNKLAQASLSELEKQRQLILTNKKIVSEGIQIDTGTLNLQEKRLQVQSQQQLKVVADSNLDNFRNKMNGYVQQASQPGADKTAILQAMAVDYQTLQSISSQIGANAGTGYSENLFSPFKSIYESSVNFANGKTSSDAYANEVTVITNRSALNILGDPKTARIVSLVKLVPSTATTLSTDINQIALGTFGKNEDNLTPDGKPTKPANPFDDASKDSFGSYLNFIQARTGEFARGNLAGGEDAEKQLDRHMGRIMAGVSTYKGVATSPEDMNQLANFVASDAFGAYVAKKGGVPGDAKTQEDVSLLFEQQYIGQAEKAISQEFLKAADPGRPRSGSPNGTALPSQVELVFQGGGAVFKTKPGVAADSYGSQKVQELNRNVAPLMNRLVRISAHLSGDRNYKAAFDSIYDNMLGSEADKTGTANE